MNSIIFKIMMLNEQIKAFRNDEKGATMIEYALVASLVAIAAMAAITGFQGQLSALFARLGASLAAVTG